MKIRYVTKKRHKVKKKKKYKKVSAVMNIRIKPNNNFFVLTQKNGSIIGRSLVTSGRLSDFQGHRRKSYMAGYDTANLAIKKSRRLHINSLYIRIRGAHKNRRPIMRTFRRRKVPIKEIYDLTPIQHGGCRFAKPRRK